MTAQELVLPQDFMEEIATKVASFQCTHTTKRLSGMSDGVSDEDDVEDQWRVNPRMKSGSTQHIKDVIMQVYNERKSAIEQESLDEQHKRRVLATIIAYWSPAHKNFTDAIMQHIRDSVIETTHAWVTRDIVMNDTIKKNLGEDKTIIKKRDNYKDTIALMKDCQQILLETNA